MWQVVGRLTAAAGAAPPAAAPAFFVSASFAFAPANALTVPAVPDISSSAFVYAATDTDRHNVSVA